MDDGAHAAAAHQRVHRACREEENFFWGGMFGRRRGEPEADETRAGRTHAKKRIVASCVFVSSDARRRRCYVGAVNPRGWER